MVFIIQSKQQLIILLPGRFVSGSLVWLSHEEWRPSIPYNGPVFICVNTVHVHGLDGVLVGWIGLECGTHMPCSVSTYMCVMHER